MATDVPLKVIIIGAGTTGLLLAQGLKQNGIEYGIFEREDASSYKTRPREWGMTLHWGTEYISKCIPPYLMARLQEICCDPYYDGHDGTIPHHNGKTGELLFAMPGVGIRRVSRRKMRQLFSDGLEINYGKKITNIQRIPDGRGVTATFEDGSSVSGDLIVGCDGAKSIVRELLVGEDSAQVLPTDIHMFNFTCSYTAETAKFLRMRHPILKNSYHPDFNTMFLLTIQDVPDPSAPETWKYQLFMSWSGEPRPDDFPDQASRTAFFKSRAEHWAEPWRTAAREMSDDITFPTDRCTIWTPSSDWSSSPFAGVVTIAGDAAHPMAPHRGQGLNNALQDATHLVEQLQAVAAGNKTLTDAVQAYEDEMRPRAVEEIPISLKQAQMVHNFDTLMQSPMVKLGLHKAKDAEKLATAATTTTNNKAEGNSGISTAVSA